MEWVLRGNRWEVFQTRGIACVLELKVLHSLNMGCIKGSSNKGWKWRHGTNYEMPCLPYSRDWTSSYRR